MSEVEVLGYAIFVLCTALGVGNVYYIAFVLVPTAINPRYGECELFCINLSSDSILQKVK